MTTKTNPPLDLEARIEALEAQATNPAPTVDLSPLENRIAELASAMDTERDATEQRLSMLENTVRAMEDAMRANAPASVEGIGAELDKIKGKMNDVYLATFGAGPDLPFPPPEPSIAE